MSDDRFKQARRSLIDRHNQRQQEGGWDDSFGDDFEDEATALVNLDGQPAFAPPPNFSDEEDEDARTEMIRLDDAMGQAPGRGPMMRSHSGIQPSYDSFGGPGGGGHGQFDQPSGQFDQPSGQFDQGPGHMGGSPNNAAATQAVALDQVQPVPSQFAPAPSGNHAFGGGPDPNQSLVIGGGSDGVDFEENTAFINLNDFAQGGEQFTPDSTAAGYEGNTQFVNIAALQASGPPGETPVEHDQILKQSYQFGPESIQQGEFTLIFAQNQQGAAVVLKRIWEGDPNGMPIPVRQRIAALDQIRHPRLVSLNGMIAAPSGAWVELARPPGYRLTDVISGNGPQDPNQVQHWVDQISEILGVIHAQAFVYANLTTDAVWIQEDGSVILEPFDVLSYEARGNLGVFGPPELNFPPDQQQLSPGTDVYSLAAVTVAALTGVPLNLGAVEGLEKNTKNAVIAALNQDPSARPADPGAFVAALRGKRARGKKAGGKKSKVKMAIPVIFLLGCVGLGAAWFLNQPPPQMVDPPTTNNAVIDPVTTTIAAAGTNNGVVAMTNGGTGGTTGVVAAPITPSADVVSDPRLKIRTSLALNPPTNDSNEPSADDLDAASAYRDQAREQLEDIDNLTQDGKRARIETAMAQLAKAARLSGGMTAADEELFQELSKSPYVNEIRGGFYERVDKSLKEERISRVKQVYPQLAGVDAEAKEVQFFETNRSVTIKSINPVETQD